MKSKGIKVCALLFLLVGIAVLVYPMVSSSVNRLFGSRAVQSFQKQIEHTDQDILEEERMRAEDYNIRLMQNPNEFLETEYLQLLDFEDGMMGYITIAKIDLMLPIYHGVGDAVLTRGVGHLPSSGLPIGGIGNHTILTGHTGLPSAELFTELTELEVGDTFCVTVLGEALTYKVDQIKVVLPEETQELVPVAGEDLCTLVTCTPYGINSHRLLVRGCRVPMEQLSESGFPLQEILLPRGMVLLTGVLFISDVATVWDILIRKRRFKTC